MKFILALLLSQSAFAKIPLAFDVPISKGANVSIEKYDSVSRTYTVVIVGEEGVGPNIAMPGDLADAIGAINLKKIEDKPEMVVGNTYKLDKELRLITEKGVELRIKALKAKKK